MRSWSQRLRSWSSSRIGSPPGPVRALSREAWISMRARRPWTSESRGASRERMRPSRIAFVEDGVDDLEDGGEPPGALVAVRDFERNLAFGQCAFRADDALGDRAF